MASTKQIDWGDGSGEKITVSASSFSGNKNIQISSPENIKVTPRSKTIILKLVTNPNKVARINVTQQKAVYTYAFALTASVITIAAKGGNSVITAQLKTYRNGNLVETKAVTPILSGSGTGFSISGTTVTASNRTTVVGAERRITVTGKFSGTFDGQEVTATVIVSQQANVATYGAVSISGGAVSDIPASGGSVSSASGISATQTVSFTSGSTRAGSVTVSYSAAVRASSLGTTIKARTKVGILTATASGEGGKSSQKSFDIYQQANAVERYNYGSWTISISANPTTIAYSGGTSNISATCTRSEVPVYTSGATGSPITGSATPTLSGAATGFTLSGTTVTASANSAVSSRSITVTASYSGATSKSVTINQDAAPASIALSVTTLNLSQRADSGTVTVTSNSGWATTQNDDFEIPVQLQIKYNPYTDIVDLVDQPWSVYKKIQDSNNYYLALVRIGAMEYGSKRKTRNTDIVVEKNEAGYTGETQHYLLIEKNNQRYQRVIPRVWFTLKRSWGPKGRSAHFPNGQISVLDDSTLITKPGFVTGIRGCHITNMTVKLRTYNEAKAKQLYISYNVPTYRINNNTGRLLLVVGPEFRHSRSDWGEYLTYLTTRATSTGIGPLGYILIEFDPNDGAMNPMSNLAYARSLAPENYAKTGGLTVKLSDRVVAVPFIYGL